MKTRFELLEKVWYIYRSMGGWKRSNVCRVVRIILDTQSYSHSFLYTLEKRRTGRYTTLIRETRIYDSWQEARNHAAKLNAVEEAKR